ncbi:transposable element Tcb2 transposase [Trichonephila clavipes]|nr:transposable element Tcb2 transposase [Trichonephila clavipes]
MVFERGVKAGAREIGHSISEIAMKLGFSRTAISRVYREYQESSKTSNLRHLCGRKNMQERDQRRLTRIIKRGRHATLPQIVTNFNADPTSVTMRTIQRNFIATRGLLATDHVILNHGQVTWTTPELAPPLLTTTPHQREDVSALNRFNVHRCPTRRVFSGTGLEPVTKQATVRYLYHSATAAPVDDWKHVAWSEEYHFQLNRADGRVLVWRKPHESMNPTCPQGTVEDGGGSVMKWSVCSWRDMRPLIRLDTTLTDDRYIRILSDQLHPFMSIVHSDLLVEFQQVNATPTCPELLQSGSNSTLLNLDTSAGHQKSQT